MSTLTSLVSGGTLTSRLAELEPLKLGLPYPPIVLDGQDHPLAIKEVRQFQSQIFYLPETNTLQRHFILEAQNLSLPAQHALLKTLEEPPRRTQIILTVDRPSNLLPTILSRCFHQPLSAPPVNVDPQLLRTIASSSPGQLIDLASSLSRQDPESTVSQLLHTLHQGLIHGPNLKRASALRLAQTALLDLKTNLAKQLILEHFFFSLRALSQH